MWIAIKDKLPEHGCVVLVKVSGGVGVAEYDKHFGFSADSSAYDITCLDDSGLQVSLDGDVTHWMPLPGDRVRPS